MRSNDVRTNIIMTIIASDVIAQAGKDPSAERTPLDEGMKHSGHYFYILDDVSGRMP